MARHDLFKMQESGSGFRWIAVGLSHKESIKTTELRTGTRNAERDA